MLIHRELGLFLEEVAKVQRIMQFYPVEHPMVLRGIERLEGHLRRFLPHGSRIDLVIQKNAVLYQHAQIPGKEELLKSLAYTLTLRFVREVHFELPVGLRDLRAFLLLLVRDPREIREAQGPEAFLAREGAERIWVNARKFELNQIAEEESQEEREEEAVEEIEISDRVREFLEKLGKARGLGELAEILEGIVSYVRDEVKLRKEEVSDGVRLLEGVSEEEELRADPEEKRILKEALQAIAFPPVIQGEIARIEKAPESKWLRHARVLAKVGPEVTPFLVQVLSETHSRRYRMRLMRAIRLLGKPAVRFLVRFLTDSRWYLVRNVLILLGDLGDPSLVPLVKPLLDHREPRVRAEALECLRRLGGEEAFTALVDFIERNKREEERALAVEKLVSFPPPQVLPYLLEYLEEGREVGRASLRILAEFDPPGFQEMLVRILKRRPFLFFRKRYASLRPVAAELLCLKLPESWDLLKPFASDPDPEVRRWVAHAIAWLQRRCAVNA